MAEFAMDRVAKRLNDINERWINLVVRLFDLAVDNPDLLLVAQESELLRLEFANIASLGNPEAWRLLADANHFVLPDTAGPEALAEHIVRQNINIPELIEAIKNAVGGGDDRAETGPDAGG